ncbi:MAG: hypothetical protein J6Y23_10565 [Prevotella sp.]|nr:hypothetical protein [Prevotella sp.]
MKQKILLLALALLGCMNVAQAKDGVTSIQDATIKQGGFGCITIKCKMEERTYNALQIEFVLPEGLHFNQGVANSNLTGIDDPNFVMNDKKNGKDEGVFIFMNMKAMDFNEGEYNLVRIYFKADEDMEVATYPIKITALSLSGSNGKDYSPFSPFEDQKIDAPESFSVEIEAGGPRVLSQIATKLPEDNYTYVTQEVTEYEVWDDDKNDYVTKYDFGRKEEITVAEDFIVERTINANTWSTMCLPFKMSYKEALEAFGDDAQIAIWWIDQNPNNDAIKYDSKNNILELNFLPIQPNWPEETQESFFESRKPFLIKTSKAINNFTVREKYLGDYYETEELDEESGMTVTKRVYTSPSKLNTDIIVKGSFDFITGTSTPDNSFKGVLTAGYVPEGCLFFSGNKFYYSTGWSTINAFRAYFDLGYSLNPKEIDGSVNVGILINDVPTFVEGISTKYVGNGDVYSVSGIKMGTESDLNNMKPGMYIVNGKKVIVK